MNSRNRILIVDDAEINRSLLSDMLCKEYDILEAKNGLEAVACIKRHHASLSLILLDIVMPEMDGFDVMRFLNNSGYAGGIPVIVISTESAAPYLEQAYALGAAEYIRWPFDEKTVKRRVKNTITLYAKQKRLEDMVSERLLEKEKSNLILVDVLSHLVEFRGGESGLHVLHIRVVTETLLKWLARTTDAYQLPLARISLIANASVMHDIGKICIPDRILNKPSRLTDEEYAIVKTHSVAGARMLESLPYYQSEELIRVSRDICRWHHERYDGGGYPDGLKGEEIPIAAQVVALADVYDALTNQRVYKPTYSHKTALNMILQGECGAFNPLLMQCLRDIDPYLERELKVRSARHISQDEIQNATRGLLQNDHVSNRSLALLEQERTKYLFFASMSNEIVFEYDTQSDLLTMSDFGAAYLGMPAVIMHPRSSKALAQVFSGKDYRDLRKRLYMARRESPVVTQIYRLTVKGEKRWFKAVARPLWMDESAALPTGVIGKFIDINEEQLELAQLKKQARYDSLTGLCNREYACTLITRALERAQTEERRYALLLIDLDDFKTANDRYGHMFGDRVLETVAGKLRKGTRESDVIARIGGDEFLIFLEYRKSTNVAPLIERVFSSLRGCYQAFEINASMGVALSPRDGADYDTLFHKADQALYAAKLNGRRQYCCYDDSMKNLLSVLSPVESEETT